LFTFEVGGSLDTFKIDHRIEQGIEIEKLQRLNGEPREINRAEQFNECLSPGKQLLHELMARVGQADDLLLNYRFNLQTNERIAERPALVVNLIPVNADRYGYSIGIDQVTKLPLRIILLAPNNLYLERMQFIELEEFSGDATSTPVFANASNAASTCQHDQTPSLEGWTLAWLPSGFVFAGQRKVATGDDMLLYTDGLASFSVFIGRADAKPPVREARAQLGATTVYMARRDWQQSSHSVTVVGEVPLATAQRIAANINPQ
jgi:sigma-E factor negative regulatory protein RseB